MKPEYIPILVAAVTAPGLWEVIKLLIQNIHDLLTGTKRTSMSEVGEKLDIQRKEIDFLKKAFLRKNEEDEEREAKAARRRILRADDELRMDVKHSKDFFEDILRDIDFYETYCDTHTHFKNKCAESAIRNVVMCYDECKRKNSFL